jgi:hypothetical protein
MYRQCFFSTFGYRTRAIKPHAVLQESTKGGYGCSASNAGPILQPLMNLLAHPSLVGARELSVSSSVR